MSAMERQEQVKKVKIERKFLIAFLSLSLFLFFSFAASAATLSQTLSGRILLDVENKGEAWYIYPKDLKRYYLGRPTDAYNLMRTLGLGITDADLAKLQAGDSGLRSRLKGKILLQVQRHGEAYYVNPLDYSVTYMKDGDAAFTLMRKVGLGITAVNLATITIGSASATPASTILVVNAAKDDFSKVEEKTVATDLGNFAIQLITLQKDKYQMVTPTGNTSDCYSNCAAKKLDQYITEQGGQIGIHGTYFCPPDYSGCVNQTYSFLGLAFNSSVNTMINEYKLRWHNGPLVMIDTAGNYHYFHRSVDFGYTLADYNNKNSDNVAAALGNYPSLVENGTVIVHNGEDMDDKQRTVKGYRGAIGYNDSSVFLVVAKSATVIDLASIMKSVGATYAMNLDGGGSTALYYYDHYLTGPGRLLPNAIVFKKKF